MKRVLVTGGAGYIGSHAVVQLLDKGYEVVVLDNLENGYSELVDKRAKFYLADLRDKNSLRRVFEAEKIDAVMNFAAYIKVGESVEKPTMYYENNTYGVMNLIDIMVEYGVKNIVFSSTAAVYGEVKGDKLVDEEFPTDPINPYGMSKLMSERIIADAAKAYGLNYSIFRYFNVAGAHEEYEIGQKGEGITALVPIILQVAKGERKELGIFGDNYNTPDGTGVRDYIHVVDLVDAHILALDTLKEGVSGIYNLGNGNGFSVLEMLEAAKRVTEREIPSRVVPARPGDPACVVAASERAGKILGWKPRYTRVEDIIRTAWEWEQKL